MRWISTPQSVENNESTVLAIVETALAVVAYWGIAWWFDTHIHLLVSICVAPLLLLRSRESTEKGARWFMAYWRDRTEITWKDTLWRFGGMVLLVAVSEACAYYWLADLLLVNQSGRGWLGGVFLLGAFGFMMATIIAVAGMGIGALAVIKKLLVIGRRRRTPREMRAMKWRLLWFFWLPLAAGIWLRALTVRLVATLRHPLRGLAALPENWRYILAMDFRHAPELVPGLAAHDDFFSPSGFAKKIYGGWENRLSYEPPLLLLWFLPALLYRWSLKSTCWLYLPIIYLGGGLRRRPHTPKERGDLMDDLYQGRVEGIRRWLAIGVTVSLVITTALNYPVFQTGIQQSLSDAPKLLQFYLRVLGHLEHISLPYLWAFNLFDLAPWQWLNILGVTLTGGLFFYSDRVNRIWTLAKEETPGAAPEEGHVAWLLLMARLRDLCAILYILLAFGYCVLALGGIDKELLTGWLEPLGFLYGPYL